MLSPLPLIFSAIEPSFGTIPPAFRHTEPSQSSEFQTKRGKKRGSTEPKNGAEISLDILNPQAIEFQLDLPPSPPSPKTRGRRPKKKDGKTGKHVCTMCNTSYSRNFDLLRHQKSKHATLSREQKELLSCPNCHVSSTRLDAMWTHCRRIPSSCELVLRNKHQSIPPRRSQEEYEELTKLALERTQKEFDSYFQDIPLPIQ